MDTELLRTKGANPASVRKASVENFALRIGERATLTPSPKRRVHGVLMGLTHDEIDRLYSEASVSVYRPEAIIAILEDNSRVPALCYNIPTLPTPQHANPEYASKLRDLARRLRLPSDYVKKIH